MWTKNHIRWMTLLLAAGGACVANWFSLNECALVTWEIFSVLKDVYFQNPIHFNFIGYMCLKLLFLAHWFLKWLTMSNYLNTFAAWPLANALYHCTFCHLIFWICSICHRSVRTIITHVFDLTPRPYLIFVIFFTRAKFLENKIYTEKRQFFALDM